MADNINSMNNNKYMLQNIDNEPEFYESLFPYSTVPQLKTESSSVSVNLPKKIFITDTTFRDGEQSRVPYTLDQTLALFDFLHELGGPNGIIEMTEFFVYSKRNREFIKKCQEREYAFPRITGWIRANLNDLKHVKELKLEETGILASISDYHISHKLNGTRQEILGRYLDVVEATLEANIIPRVHLEDVTRADMHKVVVPFVNTLRILSDYYDLPVKIRLPDTLGIGLPFPEAGLPRSIPKLVSMLRNDCDMPAKWIEFHGHNDFHMAVANSTAAWLYGAGGVNCTLLGIGERTGNTPLEAMIMTYLSLTGKNSKINTKIITDIAEYYQKNIGYSIPVHQPFVGENFNTTRAGIHADGLIKNPRVYLSYNTTEILGRPARVAITHTSGTAGIAYWIKTHFKESNIIISKRSSSVEKIHSLIQHQYETGRITAISDIEMYKFIEECFPELSSSSVKTL